MYHKNYLTSLGKSSASLSGGKDFPVSTGVQFLLKCHVVAMRKNW